VRNFVAMGRRAIEAGKKAPVAYMIPAGQPDSGAVERLVDVLRVGRGEVERTTASLTVQGMTFQPGSYVVRLDQPYRGHAKDLLEVQRFPRMEQYPGGPPERPYDVAGWTLPLQMGVTVFELKEPLSVQTTRVTDADPRVRCVARAAVVDGPAAGDTKQFGCLTRHARIGLYKSWTASMDEGWTRWVLDDFKIPYVSLTDSAVRAGSLRRRFDVIVIPDLSLREVREGMTQAQVPPPYSGGMGVEGLAALKRFVDEGGHVVLVDMAEDHEIGGVELFSDVVGHDRRVEGGLCVGAAHDDLVGIRVFPVLLAEEYGDAAEIGTRNGAFTRFRRFGVHAGH